MWHIEKTSLLAAVEPDHVVLFGGPLLESGCADPSESDRLFLSETAKAGRSIAGLGRQLIRLLLGNAFDDRGDMPVSIRIDATCLSVYERPGMTTDDWRTAFTWSGGVQTYTSKGDLYMFKNSLHWARLSWPMEFSPFSFDIEFWRGELCAGKVTGTGVDSLDVLLIPYEVSVDRVVSRLAETAQVLGYDFGLTARYDQQIMLDPPGDIVTQSPVRWLVGGQGR
jgi:hypothetical protein